MKKLQNFWDGVPKELKVLVYMIGAGIIDSILKWLSPELINFMPVAYRVLAWNFVEVVVIEGLKRARVYLQSR